MEIKIDESLCRECGICVNICPEVFELRRRAAIVKTSEVSGKIVNKV